jgi:hypothetical protein
MKFNKNKVSVNSLFVVSVALCACSVELCEIVYTHYTEKHRGPLSFTERNKLSVGNTC